MLKLDQAIEAIKELKELAENPQFKADLEKMKQLKGLSAEEKIEAVKELKVVIPPFAKLIKAFTGEKVDLLVDDIVEIIDVLFDTQPA